MNADDLSIPESPTSAAGWLIDQTNDVLKNSGSVVNADEFFASAYDMMKHNWPDDNERALFTLTLKDQLDKLQAAWWTGLQE